MGGTAVPHLRPLLLVAAAFVFGASLLLMQSDYAPDSLKFLQGKPAEEIAAIEASCAPFVGNESSVAEPVSLAAAVAEPEPASCAVQTDIITEFGKHNVRLSRAYSGSGFRTERLLRKAQQGGEIKIGVIGGSVSLGHGDDGKGHKHVYGAIPPNRQWHTHAVKFFTDFFPQGKTKFLQGSKAAAGSGYFRYCLMNQLKEEPDLVLIELGVNDSPLQENMMADAESMLRSILAMKTEPAVIYVNTLAARQHDGKGGMQNGGDVHRVLASFFDIPMVDIRTFLAPQLIVHQNIKPYFKTDSRHIDEDVHQGLGRLVYGYLAEQLCELEKGDTISDASEPGNPLWPKKDILRQVPDHSIFQDFNSPALGPALQPFCSEAGRSLRPKGKTSWKITRYLSKVYYEATKAGETISFDVVAQNNGVVAVTFLRSAQYDLGRAECRVEGAGAEGLTPVTIQSWWDRPESILVVQEVARGIPAGRYVLSCTTAPRDPKHPETGTAFRISTVIWG